MPRFVRMPAQYSVALYEISVADQLRKAMY